MVSGADSLFPLFCGKLKPNYKIKEVRRVTSKELNEYLLKENTELKSMIEQLNATVTRLAANSESQAALMHMTRSGKHLQGTQSTSFSRVLNNY